MSENFSWAKLRTTDALGRNYIKQQAVNRSNHDDEKYSIRLLRALDSLEPALGGSGDGSLAEVFGGWETGRHSRDLAGRGVLHHLVINEAYNHLRTLVTVDCNHFDLNLRDSDYMTPLHTAVYLNDPRCVAILLENPLIRTDLQDSKGRTPFKMAWRRESQECMRLLASRSLAHPRDPENMVQILSGLPERRIRFLNFRDISEDISEDEEIP